MRRLIYDMYYKDEITQDIAIKLLDKLTQIRDKKRYIRLYKECIKRGFNVQNYIKAWDNVPKELMNDYNVKANDIRIIRERINEKLNR